MTLKEAMKETEEIDFFGCPPGFNGNFVVLVISEDAGGEVYVHHACWYEGNPGQQDLADLRRELKEDPDFGLGDRVDSLRYVLLTKEKFKEAQSGFNASRTDQE